MTQNQSIYSPSRKYRVVLLALIAGLMGLQASAQNRGFGGWKHRDNSSSGANNEQRRQFPGQQNPGRGNQNQSNDRWRSNGNREPRQQDPVRNDQSNNRWRSNGNREPRQQNPVANDQSNNRWRRDGNRQEQRIEPRQAQRQPWASNDNRSRRFDNNNNNSSGGNNNRFGNRGGFPRASNYDRFRRPNWSPHYNRYNPGWRYSYLPRRNSVVTSFLFPFTTISFGGYNYRYCDGVYYRPYNDVFRVCAPPIGIYINTLPFGYSRILVNDDPYYYYNGTYYEDYDDSYRVVAPPVGAVVESIPEGYETVVIDGETYYKVDDVQYKPVVEDNGEIWYEVIKVG